METFSSFVALIYKFPLRQYIRVYLQSLQWATYSQFMEMHEYGMYNWNFYTVFNTNVV